MKLIIISIILTGCGSVIHQTGDRLDYIDQTVDKKQDQVQNAVDQALLHQRQEYIDKLDWINHQPEDLRQELINTLKGQYCPNRYIPDCS